MNDRYEYSEKIQYVFELNKENTNKMKQQNIRTQLSTNENNRGVRNLISETIFQSQFVIQEKL